jgi:hypothetical protein
MEMMVKNGDKGICSSEARAVHGVRQKAGLDLGLLRRDGAYSLISQFYAYIHIKLCNSLLHSYSFFSS